MGHLLFCLANVCDCERYLTVSSTLEFMSVHLALDSKASSFDAILDAGVEAIYKSGIDQITVAQIIGISGHSRPTFYAYFGDINGLLAEIWIKWGRHELESGLFDANDWHHQFEPVPGRHLAILQVLCVTHRTPELQEVVIPDLRDWWQQKTQGNKSAETKTAWILALQLGLGLTRRVDPDDAQVTEVMPILRNLPEATEDSKLLSQLGEAPSYKELEPVLAEPETIDETIMQATIEVIAHSGVNAASAVRIARKSRVSTGTIYPRFKSREALIEKSYIAAMRDMLRVNGGLLDEIGAGPSQFGISVSAGMANKRRTWRNFQIEMHLAALHSKQMRVNIKPGSDYIKVKLAQMTSSMPNYGHGVSAALITAMHLVPLGLSILDNLGIDVQSLDHRVPSVYLGAAYAQVN